jgi:hypothetical protein
MSQPDAVMRMFVPFMRWTMEMPIRKVFLPAVPLQQTSLLTR